MRDRGRELKCERGSGMDIKMTTSKLQQLQDFGPHSGKIASMLRVVCLLQQLLPSVARSSIDELALNDFRGNVIMDPKNAFGSWHHSAAGVCHWDHVTCNANNRVIRLDLSNQGLIGTISASLGALEFLEYLNLENNSFTGVIPVSLGQLAHLDEMNLGSNSLEGPLPESAQMMKDMYAMSMRYRFFQEPCLNCTTPATSRSSRKKEEDLPLILGILGGVTGFVLLFISLFLVWKCSMKREGHSKSSVPAPKIPVTFPLVGSKQYLMSEKARKSTRSFTIEELKIATGNFCPENVVGEGGFGLVYKGTLSTGQEVAIKHAHKDAQQVDEFYNEVELLSKVHHKYLVDLLGFCDEQALAHLHEGCTPSIIHRDIKPSNILLDNDFLAKVADFGLSKTGPVGGASHVSTGVKGTPGYLDPYYYLNWHLGAYSDVYSFGIILLQLVASKPAVDRKRRNRTSNYSLVAWAKDCLRQGLFDSIVDRKLRLQGYNRHILMVMVKLGIRCTGEEIKERPSMKSIYKELEHALETMGSMPTVNGSPEGSSRSSSSQESEELAPESVAALGDGHEQFNLYSNINFDGRSWVDIKDLGESHFHGHGQESEYLESSDIQLSTNSVHISIDSPELEVAKTIQ